MQDFVVPVRNRSEANDEADACTTISEVESMLTAIDRERIMLQRQYDLAMAFGTFHQRWLARRIMKRRGPILDAMHKRLLTRINRPTGQNP